MKKRILVTLDVELFDRTMNMIDILPAGNKMSFNKLINQLLEATMDKVEKDNGGPFPKWERVKQPIVGIDESSLSDGLGGY